jgi:NifU-like protein involved in Fe-S cluster formation
MDELVIKYYRQLLRTGFTNAGLIENPSIYLDSIGEKIRICGSSTTNFIHIYINVSEGKITEAKYLCTCDPTSNVVVEILCSILPGKTITEAGALNEESFHNVLDSRGEEYLKKIEGILELLNRGLERYKSDAARHT